MDLKIYVDIIVYMYMYGCVSIYVFSIQLSGSLQSMALSVPALVEGSPCALNPGICSPKNCRQRSAGTNGVYQYLPISF